MNRSLTCFFAVKNAAAKEGSLAKSSGSVKSFRLGAAEDGAKQRFAG